MSVILYVGDLRQTDLTIGPKTNQRTVTPLHPDMFQTSPDRGRTENVARPAWKSTFLPGLNAGKNVVMVHAYDASNHARSMFLPDGRTVDTRVFQYMTTGEEANYLCNTYGHLTNESPTEDKPLLRSAPI